MVSLRRYYHQRFGYHTRFHVAVVLTIVTVAYVAVPPVARFIEAVAGYNPAYYEPKDADRQTWLQARDPDALIGTLDWQAALGLVLFLVVAVLWMTLVPDRAPRRRPRR